jgi:molybdenum cofactor cytidylyltransferase
VAVSRITIVYIDKANCGVFYYNYYRGRLKRMKRLPSQRLGVVLLAAGSSSRMGRPKLLLPWGRTSVLGHLIRQWRALEAQQIAVVYASRARAIQRELDRLAFPIGNRIPNPNPGRGMFSSIQCAARWTGWRPGLTHWAIVLGDQPHLRRETLRRVVEFSAAHPAQVCQPARHGHGRHPVLIPKAVMQQLRRSSAATLKGFLIARPGVVARCEIADPGLELDIDHPADYQKAVRLRRRTFSEPIAAVSSR